MQWIVLCGIPYRGSGALASPDPTNSFHYLSFPLPTLRAGPKATGRLYCLLQLFESNTVHSHLQAVRTANLLARLQLLRIATISMECKPRVVESASNLWETANTPVFIGEELRPGR